jgi:hypothetical protein
MLCRVVVAAAAVCGVISRFRISCCSDKLTEDFCPIYSPYEARACASYPHFLHDDDDRNENSMRSPFHFHHQTQR